MQGVSVCNDNDSDSQDMQFRITMRTGRTLNTDRLLESPAMRPPHETLDPIEESKERDPNDEAKPVKSVARDNGFETEDSDDDDVDVEDIAMQNKSAASSEISNDDSFW
mmetsp:Transcript_21440/g.28769  ORF Transcript_21440/g.28769 Transcript_21440/m.28769 type:complete len:109 (+) Transcript_21440:523-849(+)|eukprot:CAMPEP_0185597532 /NCGR_PEP_ID=MMETSP0434-20130131/81424_1 /TAXON_ID=626734 ORGANISM="Favella taraikaensis, Strain Fe Narragansett Bay" /NCGR_SAMPLE_ID=MMETSP0434 /ASSEMBLY_ACC=CAM_ASM_000379 /LENGTH=108 /DNA_ID=CAMNT_0028226277 /DNA_START=1297 /DNA_END=1623 /DNA_ORIENTATION=-